MNPLTKNDIRKIKEGKLKDLYNIEIGGRRFVDGECYVFFFNKDHINRVNSEISDECEEKTEALAYFIARTKDIDVKKLLMENISPEIAKKIYCDYYSNLYMLSEEDDNELKDYFGLKDEQLENVDDELVEETYNKIKENKNFDDYSWQNKKMNLSQIRNITKRIQNDKLEENKVVEILIAFSRYLNADDYVNFLKNDLDDERALLIYKDLNKEKRENGYRIPNKKRIELEGYFLDDEKINNKVMNFEKNDKVEEVYSLNAEKIMESSEEEKLDLIFDNPNKFSPEEIIDTIINLSGYKMIDGYRRFKEKFKNEEQIKQIENDIVKFLYDNKSRMESNEIKEILLDLSDYGLEQGYEKLKDYNGLEPEDNAEINNRMEECKGTLKEKIKNKNSIFQRVWNGIIQLVQRNK